MLVRKEYRGIYGFLGGTSAKMCVIVFTQAHGRHTVNENCESLPKARALDAEIRSCAMLMECMSTWIGRCTA